MSRRAFLLEDGLLYVREGLILIWGAVSFFHLIADAAAFFISSSTKMSAMTVWSLGMICRLDWQRKLIIAHTITFSVILRSQ